MIVLSHRGYWKDVREKNQAVAFERSFSLGFGTETDIRDCNGCLVISHDIPSGNELPLEDFFTIYKKSRCNSLLALNIKADGLQLKLKELIQQFNITEYFVFDMSVPDALQYIKHEINSFTRESEYEREPSFYDEAAGVWLDEFRGHWIDKQVIELHLKNKKQVS